MCAILIMVVGVSVYLGVREIDEGMGEQLK